MNKCEIMIHVDAACDNILGRPLSRIMGIGVHGTINGDPDMFVEQAYNFGTGTNNIGEWQGCVKGFVLAREMLTRYVQHCGPVAPDDISIKIHTDSQVICYQYNGIYKMKNKEFKPYYHTCWLITKNIKEQFSDRVLIQLLWVPREENKHADKLSKMGLLLKPEFFKHPTN